jgi:hypothetical protein
MPFHRKLAQFIELNLRYMFVIVLKENKYSILFYIKLTLHKLCLTPPPYQPRERSQCRHHKFKILPQDGSISGVLSKPPVNH